MITMLGVYSGFACPTCHALTPPLSHGDFDSYFRGQTWVCPECAASQSLFTLLKQLVREENILVPGAVGLGAASSAIGQLVLRRNELVELNFGDLGVPENATILSVIFTSLANKEGAALTPAWVTQSLTRAPVPHILALIGHPLGGEADHTQVNVLCTWLNAAEPEMQPLMSALEAYTDGFYRHVVVPASVAVEDKLSTVLRNHYLRFAGKNKVDNFLSDGATFGYQLSPLLPSLMEAFGAPALPEEVASLVSALRTLRNKVAHEHRDVSRNEAGDA